MVAPLPPLLARVVSGVPAAAREVAQALFVEALTHRTYVNEHARSGARDNQRLELLGDAVLELIVTRLLFDALPLADEGLLSRARASVVNEAALADGARALDLGHALRMGRGEAVTGGRERPGNLADAMEAVVAAAYLAAGLDAATALVQQAIGPALRETIREAAPPSAPGSEVDVRAKDAKSILQELVQRRGGPPPVYELERHEGPVHARTFFVCVRVLGEVGGRGEGRSRREAEMRAAADALELVDRGPRGGRADADAGPDEEA